MSDYIIDAAAERELARLRLLEDWADPGSIRCLDAVGVGTGWHCLEVGAGAGSMAAWLAGRVGPTGHVVASDVDTRFLQGGTQANVTVLQHDLREGPPPAGPFDVVHARLLLEHLPAVDRAIGHLCAALKPGGVLVIEDQDICSVVVGDTSDPRAASSRALFEARRCADRAWRRFATRPQAARPPHERRPGGRLRRGARARRSRRRRDRPVLASHLGGPAPAVDAQRLSGIGRHRRDRAPARRSELRLAGAHGGCGLGRVRPV